jgi:hypothetical protein
MTWVKPLIPYRPDRTILPSLAFHQFGLLYAYYWLVDSEADFARQ